MNEQERKKIERELRRLEQRDGIITPPAIVEAARVKSSSLHRHFQWDDNKAAEEFRLWQARQLVGVVLYQRPPDGLQRVYTSVIVETTTNGDTEMVRAYVSTERCLHDPEMRQQVLQQAVAEIGRWAHKYRCFHELRTIVAVVDKFQKLELAAA
jgi:hypothetical protein